MPARVARKWVHIRRVLTTSSLDFENPIYSSIHKRHEPFSLQTSTRTTYTHESQIDLVVPICTNTFTEDIAKKETRAVAKVVALGRFVIQ